MRARIDGWDSWHRHTDAGAVESEQRARLDVPVVVLTEDGARELGRAYWSEVERATIGLVRRGRGPGVELRLLGRRPVLLCFREAEVAASRPVPSTTRCRAACTGRSAAATSPW